MIKRKQHGFTIVELLVVIVVVAILAAITVVAYSGIQQRGRDARRASDIVNIAKAIQRWGLDTGKDYSAMPMGNVLRGQGWYNISYGEGSIKSVLVNASYLTNNVDDPLNLPIWGQGSSAYMLVECTTGNDKTRVVLANMEAPQAQTVAQQIGVTCNSTSYTNYLSNYYMDYARLVTLD